MSEKEIRRIIQEICADLDRHARMVARQGRKVVLPAMVGASLALGGCDRSARMMYGVPTPDGGKIKDKGAAKEDGLATTDGKVATDSKAISDLAPVYMAPDAAIADLPPTPPYMAPDAGVQPPYMAPDVGRPSKDLKSEDAGPTPLYMAPPFPKDDGGKK
jgi:hypothetical protein